MSYLVLFYDLALAPPTISCPLNHCVRLLILCFFFKLALIQLMLAQGQASEPVLGQLQRDTVSNLSIICKISLEA